jgi:hypothetical protein
MAGPFVDIVFFGERSVVLFGTGAAFSRTVAENGTRFHSCSEPENRPDVVIGEPIRRVASRTSTHDVPLRWRRDGCSFSAQRLREWSPTVDRRRRNWVDWVVTP